MSTRAAFDPYALFTALDTERVGYVVVGAFARVVHGSAELTDGLDVVPSLQPDNLRRLGRALEALGAHRPSLAERLTEGKPVTLRTHVGELRLVPEPWGTRGYDDLRIRANRENLGRGARPAVASAVDCVRMLDASQRQRDVEPLVRMRRMMELERQLVRDRRLSRGLRIER
jgi:hypothetical protein